MKDRISKEHLNLRKSHLDKFLSSKRKITQENYSINDSKYKLFEADINIPNQFEIDYNKFILNVI
jgi:hypothetical protein